VFILLGQYKEKDSGKNQALTILDARWKEWGFGANFPKATEA
jgi:hypothetical protein